MTTSKPTSLPILSVDFMTLALLPRLFCVSIYILFSLLFLGFLFASVYLSFSILCTCKCLFHCSPLFKPLTLFFFEWAFSLTLYPFSVFFLFYHHHFLSLSHSPTCISVISSIIPSFLLSQSIPLFLSLLPSFPFSVSSLRCYLTVCIVYYFNSTCDCRPTRNP